MAKNLGLLDVIQQDLTKSLLTEGSKINDRINAIDGTPGSSPIPGKGPASARGQKNTIDLDLNPVNVSDKIKNLETELAGGYKTSIMSRGLNIERIEPTDWSKSYPYGLAILRVEAGSDASNPLYYEVLSLALSISPQELTIAAPYANNLTITSRGVLEEYNGAPIRQISFSGTTGILTPDFLSHESEGGVDSDTSGGRRGSYDPSNASQTDAGTVFGTTISAFNELTSLMNYIGSNNNNSFSTSQKSLNTIDASQQGRQSGYYRLHLLRSLLELYNEIKRGNQSNSGKSYRLAFVNKKDNVIYLITPKNFTYRRSASSPMEYTYSFQGTAWGTLSTDSVKIMNKASNPNDTLKNDIGQWQRFTNIVSTSRDIIRSSLDLVKAAKTDVETSIIGPLTNVILIVKDVYDFPKNIVDIGKSFERSLKSTASFWNSITLNVMGMKDAIVNDSSSAADKKVKLDLIASMSQPRLQSGAIPGLDLSAFKSPSAKSTDNAANDKKADRMVYSAGKAASVSGLELTYSQQQLVADTIENAYATEDNDIIELIENIDQLAETVGPIATEQGSDSPYWSILNACNDINTQMYSLLSSGLLAPESPADLIQQFYVNTAAENGIDISSHGYKFEVPFPAGTNLEWLAQNYLGDAARWMEIVAANNLKAPYIDEAGFVLPLLTNANGRQFSVTSIDNLQLNQIVYLYSDTVAVTKRKIQSIKKVTLGNYIISVDGEADLDKYKTANNAKMKSYLPNTVNSQMTIYIPTDTSTSLNSVDSKLISVINTDEQLLEMAYIDFQLDADGDLVVQQDGFTNIAYGKANLIQALILKFKIALGELMLHPGFGAGIEIGSSEADVTIDNIKNSIISTVTADPRFKSVESMNIYRESGVVDISLTVLTANDDILPLSFRIN